MVKLKFIQSFYKGFVAIALLCSSLFANAVIIESELTSLGGNSYQYDFNVINNDLTDGLEGFTVYFDETLFANLSDLATPAGWLTAIIPTVPPPFGLEGWYDSGVDTALPIASNSSLAGFSVGFDWIGGAAGPPKAGNNFEVYSFLNNPFQIEASGITTPIPEPGLLSLFGLALLFVGARKRIG